MDGQLHDVGKWDLLIAHPPCTYLSNAGAKKTTYALSEEALGLPERRDF